MKMKYQGELYGLQLPLKQRFVPKSKGGLKKTDSFILRLEDRKGRIAFGEANFPSKSNSSKIDLLAEWKQVQKALNALPVKSYEGIQFLLSNLEQKAISAPLRTALEMALIDLWSQREGISIPKLFDLDERKSLAYSMFFPIMELGPLETLLIQFASFDPPSVKIEINQNWEESLKRLRLVKKYFNCPIQIQVLDYWSRAQAKEIIPLLINEGVLSVDGALDPEDFKGLYQLTRSFGSDICICAAEAITSLKAAEYLISHRCVNAFNIKLSNVGGIGAAFNIYNLAMEYGLKCQLGSHLGASSLSTRAGMTLAAYPDIDFKFLEGAFENFLLKEDLFLKPISYNPKGKTTIKHCFPLIGYGKDINFYCLRERGSVLKRSINTYVRL